MCDSMVAMKDNTRDGFTIFAKNSDRAVNEPQYFTYVPSKDHIAGSKVRCTFIEIEQASHTYATVLSKPSWIWGGEIGVNECGVCIGNEAIYSKEPRESPALMGMDLLRIGLERGSTAREAMDEITKALEVYGQGNNCSFDAEFYYDNAFLITDPDEAWILDTAGRYWAAKKVTGVRSISNFMSIGKPDKLHSGAVGHAKECGWKVSPDLDFTRSYSDWDVPANYNGMVRGASSTRLLNDFAGEVTVENMMDVLRSHTTNEPWIKGNFSVCKHATGAAGPHQTTASLITVLRPDNVLLWGTGMSIPCIAPFKPFWLDAYSDRLVFHYDRQEQAMDSWLLRERLNRAAVEGRLDVEEYTAELNNLQADWIKQVEMVSKGDRKLLCEQIADQEASFIEKWIALSDCRPFKPLEGEAFQKFWAEKNKQLGINRKIAY